MDTLQRKLEGQLKNLKDQNTDLIRTIHAKVEKLIEAIQNAQIRQQIRKQYREEIAPTIAELEDLTATPEKKEIYQPGDRVWVQLYRDIGKVLSIKKDQAEVLIRNIRFTVPVNTLEKRETVQESLPRACRFSMKRRKCRREINVIGKTVEEAWKRSISTWMTQYWRSFRKCESSTVTEWASSRKRSARCSRNTRTCALTAKNRSSVAAPASPLPKSEPNAKTLRRSPFASLR